MFVLNPVLSDPRVMREARTLQESGYRLTIIGQHDELKKESVQDGIRIILLQRNILFRLVLKLLKGRTAAQPASPAMAPATAPPGIIRRMKQFIFDCGEIAHMILTNIAMAAAGIRLGARVYHSHDLNTLLAGYAASRMKRARLVYDFHEAYTEQFPHDATTACWRGFYTMLERLLIRKADRLITVCGSLSAWAQELYAAPAATVIMNTSTFRETDRPAPGNASPDITVLYHGIYLKDRGLEQLIEAVKHFPTGMRLLMRGKGEIEPLLRAVAEREGVTDRVYFAPPVKMEELISAAAAADIGVIPYIATNLNNKFSTPNKLFEYMMAGLAIAGSNLPELQAIILGEQIGEVFDPTSPKDIARAIIAIATDRDKLGCMKQTALTAAKEKYNWEQESRKLLGIYSDLCAE
jgi:glycosyltransferase involved in cell wall biosynthesis